MSVSITLIQEHTIIDNEGSVTYRILDQVTASEGISLALFVFKTEDQAYSRPATVYDLDAYPESYNEAVNLGLDYYRLPEVTKDFDAISAALSFEAVIRSRLQVLANELPKTQEGLFDGTNTYVFATA